MDNNQKPVMVALCAAALVLIISLIAIFVVNVSGDPYGKKILNNVTVAGVNVGGMSKSDAITAVRAVTDQTYTKQAMVVTLGDTTLQLSPSDTGAKLDVKAAVNAAYAYGRTGTKAERQEAYQASLRSNHIIGLLPLPEPEAGLYQGRSGGLRRNCRQSADPDHLRPGRRRPRSCDGQI